MGSHIRYQMSSLVKGDFWLNALQESRVNTTSPSAIFRACKYAIKDTDDVLPAKDGMRCPYV